ncbi:hypothetical protein [Roseixanthobacter pseudopolyaromaticivorans]|uniref:hypothetical protein n=1 Tax=Xanthobacteraceae TaxID=335928 RepID=UPI00372900A1
MTSFLQQKTISFSQPFELRGIDGAQAAGDYIVETENEQISDVSHPAYRLVATSLHLPLDMGLDTRGQIVSVSQNDLDAALMKDRDQTV